MHLIRAPLHALAPVNALLSRNLCAMGLLSDKLLNKQSKKAEEDFKN